MESMRLIEATGADNIELLQKNGDDFAFVSVSESLRHKAATAGNLSMVEELLKHNYKLARELNTDGFRALDVAVIMGRLRRNLSRWIPKSAFSKGEIRKPRFILQLAEAERRLWMNWHPSAKTVSSMLLSMARLHFTLLSEATSLMPSALVKWLEVYELQEIINWKDYHGNTVLHLAASTKQYECLELLLRTSNIRQTVNSNAKNSNGLTALDVFDIVMETSDDLHTREILELAGAVKAATSTASSAQNLPLTGSNRPAAQNVVNHGSKSSLEWIKYFQSQAQTDPPAPSEMRNVLLIGAALFTTLAFQAGLQPPPTVTANKFFHFLFLFCMSIHSGLRLIWCCSSLGVFPSGWRS